MVQEEIPFKGFSYLELWRPFCSAEGNNLCNLSRGYYVEQFYEIIVKNGSVVQEEMSFKIILTSGALAALLCSGVEPFMQF